MRRLGVMLLIGGLVLSSPASAATIQSLQGQIFINRGKGFQNVQEPMELRAGYLIRANLGGSAKIVYPDGCVVNVRSGSVVRVGAASPCKAKYAADLGGRLPEEEGFIRHLGPFAIGTAVVFTLFCLHTFCDDDDDRGRRRPASP